MSSQAQNYEQSGEKSKLATNSEEKAKLTPRTIRKAAELSAENNPQLLDWIKECPKKFEYYRGELFFDAQEFLEGLHIKPATDAPTLSLRPDGRYRYGRVENYNLIWLARNKQKNLSSQVNLKSSYHLSFGQKIGGFLLEEWLEMNSRKNYSIKCVHLFGQLTEYKKAKKFKCIKMP